MKTSNILSAALIALGLVATAKADTVVYLTGSTAFRSTVYAALDNNNGPANGGVFDSGTVTSTTYGNSSANGANYMVFHGTIGGTPMYINCAWSGSEAGIASACDTTLTNQDRNGNPITLAGSPEVWLNITNVTLTSGGNTISTNPTTGSIYFEPGTPHGADLSQADTSQAISWTPPVASAPNTELQDFGVEALVTFTLSKNVQPNPSNEWTRCSNITLPQLNILLQDGVVPAGFLTGNTNDNDFSVYLVGRNLGSGTRMNTLGCSQYGAHRAVQQWSIGYGIEETPHQESLILTNEGNNGYESGGDVAKALAITNGMTGSCQQADPFNGGTGWYAIGYVAPSDALNAGNYGGEPTNNWITLDGWFSNNQNIENGQWWLWGHEHLYGRNGISGDALTAGNALYAAVVATVANQNYGVAPGGHDPGIEVGLMHVVKGSDVAFPTF